MSLSWLIKAQELTETLATPHRLFDSDSIRADSGQDDPIIAMSMVLIESANTGVRSSLERYHCVVLGPEEKPTGIEFQVDLIEGLLGLAT